MTETTKTAIFFAAALGAVCLAFLTRPSTVEYDVEQLRGTQLVEEFEITAPKRLRITSMNEETSEPQVFEVAEVDGVWSIPSKNGYPADATEQMAAAVEGVVGREILDVVPVGSGDQSKYGVLDPTDSSADGDTGFGTHVKLSGADDTVLADLIIGDVVKDAEGQHYVRLAKQDVVYAAEIDVDKFSTNFADWIEKDLLGLSPFDVSQVLINDYSVETNVGIEGGRLVQKLFEDRRTRMKLEYNEADSKWKPESLEAYDKGKKAYVSFELTDEQELNEDALRELKTALDDLVIVDVERKPDGLSGDLRAGQEFIDPRDPDVQETVMSLAERGFIAVPNDQGKPEILSSAGEIVVTLKNGVEYVLRFGDLQLTAAGEAEAKEKTAAEDAAAEDKENNDEGLHRYVFLMAQFNESAVEKPELEELPELPAEEAAGETETDETGAEETATEATDAAESDETSESTASESEDASDAPPAEEVTPEESEVDRKAIEAERSRIEESNKRKEEEYQEKIEEGRKRVEELNARFGDWYYVIPNDVFKKIHLGRDEVIKLKEKSEGEAAAAPKADANASPFGAPGGAIPGLPNLGIRGEGEKAAPTETDTEETDTEETDIEELDTEQPAPEQPAPEETGADADAAAPEGAAEPAETP